MIAKPILICRVSRGSRERTEIGEWLVSCFIESGGMVKIARVDQEPTTCARNKCVKMARGVGAGQLVMIDEDMIPHESFFARAMRFLLDRPGAVVIGSPYCGAKSGGHEVHVMRVAKDGSGLERVTREEAARAQNIELVRCVGTGLIACNMAAFDALTPPYFDYGYETEAQEDVSTTEDFWFCDRLSAAGGRVFVDWNCWSEHAKVELVGKPEV